MKNWGKLALTEINSHRPTLRITIAGRCRRSVDAPQHYQPIAPGGRRRSFPTMTIRNLDHLFRPKSVAVIGASTRSGTLGNIVFQNIANGGFQGALYAVNPKGGTIGGVAVHAHLADLPNPPDLAVIVTPPHAVADVVSELGERGCRAGVVLAAGFGEGGHRDGEKRRDAILAAARPHLFRIIGPNCLGILVPGIGLNASFARSSATSGRLALVAQSGAIAATLLDWAQPRGVGFSHVVTLGDMCDVDFGDMLDYLCGDQSTHAILLYVEGLTHPRKFMSAARRAARIKPVLVVKGGRNAQSAKVATSHTGALAGSDAVYDAVFARAGILRVNDLDDLFAGAELLALCPPVVGDRLAIVTNGGGLGVLATDCLLSERGHLATLSDRTLAGLNTVLPVTWSHANPVDIIGDADENRYAAAIAAVLGDPGNDAVLVLHCPTSAADPQRVAEAVVDQARSAPQKVLLTAWLGEASVARSRTHFESSKIATFATPRNAVTGFMDLVRYRKLQENLLETPPAFEDIKPHVVQEARAIIANVTEERWLAAGDVKRLLGLYGIPCNRSIAAATPADASTIARAWNCRVALKINSPDIIHKSDVGGVLLDIEPALVEIEATQLLEAVRERLPAARIHGVLVEEMVKRPDAHELFIGMTTDATFGPVIAFGHGGTGIEAINDKAFGLPPLNFKLATAMMEATRVWKLLGGYRNRQAADVKGIAHALVSLSQLVVDHPQIVDLDINPLLVDEHGLIAVDGRIKVDPGQSDSRLIISPYPRHLARTLTRLGGAPFHVRALKPEDAPLLEEFGRHLSRDDMRFRFFIQRLEIDHELAARLSQLDYDREMALIATTTEAPGSAIAIARFHADPDNNEAEFAVAVRSDLQEQGVGFALMKYLIEVATARGLRRLWGDIVADNACMLTLAKALGMRLDVSSEAGTVRAVLDLNGVP